MKERVELPISFEIGLDFAPEEIRAGHNNEYADVDCPFCGGRKKLNVSFIKNVWRCNKCGEYGNAITLHAVKNGMSTKDAYKDLVEKYSELTPEKIAEYKKVKTVVEEDDQIHIAPLSIRDFVYRTLIQNIDLSDKHERDLENRGLTEQDIKDLGYRSVPKVGLYSIGMRVLTKTGSDYTLRKNNLQVPGFYIHNGAPRIVRRNSGVLIPIVTKDGKISCFQIRFDNLPNGATEEQKEEFVRYKYLSSSEKKFGVGCSGAENIHFTGFDFNSDKTPENVVLTEGALKADVASKLSGKPFIAVLGVQMQSQLPEALKYLKEHGTKTISLAFDMDYEKKPEVAKALKSAREKIAVAGLECKQVRWPSEYKGIDDFLKAWKERQKEFGNCGD